MTAIENATRGSEASAWAQGVARSDVFVLPPPPGLLQAAGASPAQALPASIRRGMERFFSADLSSVRIHVGSEAARLGTRAFTWGEHLYFAPGQYAPHTRSGLRLLGHELTHVLQQRAKRVAVPSGASLLVVHDPELEAEAERLGALAAEAVMPVHQAGTHEPLASSARASFPARGTLQCDVKSLSVDGSFRITSVSTNSGIRSGSYYYCVINVRLCRCLGRPRTTGSRGAEAAACVTDGAVGS